MSNHIKTPADPTTGRREKHGMPRRRHRLFRDGQSASEELIEDVRALHLMLGDAVSNISVTKRTKPITIKGKLVKNARPLHRFTIWRKSDRGEALLRHRPGLTEWLDAGDSTLARVRDITYQGVRETWHRLVDEAHNFIADGLSSTPAELAKRRTAVAVARLRRSCSSKLIYCSSSEE
jgi:hypothetical protein